MFRLQGYKKRSLEEQRESLIDLLNDELSSFKAHVSIIFDSSEQLREYAQSAKLENIDVLYAPKGLTADEYIIELVEHSKNPKILTVITSDSGLARQCQHFHAQVMPIEEFIALLLKKNKKTAPTKPAYKETSSEMQRLLKIFQERLRDFL